MCVVEIHQNPINLSFKHFHFGSLRCASEKGKREGRKEIERARERRRATQAGRQKWQNKTETRRIEEKIRSKAQIFARINGDDDESPSSKDEPQKQQAGRQAGSLADRSRRQAGGVAAGSNKGHVAYENRTQ